MNITDKQYQKFGKQFLNFYMENGFGSKSKTDLDCCVYNALCEIGCVDDKKSALVIGRQLNATSASITKCKEWRFIQHKVEDSILKQQLKEVLQDNASNQTIIYHSGKLTFSVYNYAVKLYLEELLQSQRCNYDYSFSNSNISLTPQTFIYLLEQFHCDFDKSLRHFKEITEAQKDQQSPIIIQNIQNIYTSSNSTKDKVLDLLTAGVKAIPTISNFINLLFTNMK